MKKNIFVLSLAMVALLLGSCSEDYLSRYPEGGTLLEDQYQKLEDAVEGSILGIYSKMYAYGGEHDAFGQRAIDMYGDLLSGDMAMASSTYGWFETDERGLTYSYRKSYIWGYYYDVIRLCNNAINAVKSQGVPEIPEDGEELTEAQNRAGFYYGQVLAMRAWAYSGLLRYFAYPYNVLVENGLDPEDYTAVPLYDEVSAADISVMGAPRATIGEVYNFIEEDLTSAILYLDYFGKSVDRGSKLEVNADVARGILAYAMLNRGGKANADKALRYALEVIDGGKFPVMANSELLTTGFADVNASNWMWGQDVTVETTSSLATFWGQADIHTYSYAQAGDVKGIDANLLSSITAMGWDGRKDWFRANKPYQYAPDGKFYCPSTKNTTASSAVDRNWLCDNVFMRVEMMYLIAAEACLEKTNQQFDSCRLFLDGIMSQRLDLNNAEASSLYTAYLGGLSSYDKLHEAVRYNWRVEMWGEGYGMQTLRRMGGSNMLGENHLRSEKTINAAGNDFSFTIPTSETRYNPFLKADELQEDKN